MDRAQTITVVVVICVILFLMGLAAFIGQGGGREGIQSQRFRTEQQKQAEKPQPLYSKRSDRDEKRSGESVARTDGAPSSDPGGEGTQRTPDLIAKSISESIPEEPIDVPLAPIEELSDANKSAGEAIALQAAIADTPQDGLAMIATQSATLAQEQAAASIYTTAAGLYMLLDPPETDAALGALRTAASVASTPEERGAVALAYTNYLIQSGAKAHAIQYLEYALSQTADFTEANIRAWLLLGGLYEDEGDISASERAYLRAREDATPFLGQSPNAESLYREACMRLARAYRAQGDDEAAEKAVDLMNEQLAEAP